MTYSKILVIGSLNMDWVINVSHTPVAGETILGQFSEEIPGGKGGNQAYAIGNLGGSVTILGAVGNDPAGMHLVKTLSQAGVKTSSIDILPNSSSGLALISINSQGDNTITVLPNANAEVTPAYIDRYLDLIGAAEIILLQLEIPLETVYHVINYAHSLGKTIILNPAPATSSLPHDILAKVDYLTPNETELSILSNLPADTLNDIIQGGNYLLSLGVKNIITTLGSQGALLISKERTCHFEGYPAKAIDTTAAGDSFNGAIALYLSEGKSIDEAIRFANQVASITVTRKGAQTSIPSLAEVQEKYNA